MSLNARSTAARTRAQQQHRRGNPRRHKRAYGGGNARNRFYCTVMFLFALFFAINTISAFFAIFSPAFLFAIVVTIVLGMITGE